MTQKQAQELGYNSLAAYVDAWLDQYGYWDPEEVWDDEHTGDD